MTEAGALADRTRIFVIERVLATDDEFDGDIEVAGGDALRCRLQRLAQEAGLLSPHGPVECGCGVPEVCAPRELQ
jgi:hypothetical protein